MRRIGLANMIFVMNGKKRKNIFGQIIKAFFAWVVLIILVAFSYWGRSYFLDFGGGLQVYEKDLRQNKAEQGRVVTFVATQPKLTKLWLFGHIWVEYETAPDISKPNSHDYGYYSIDQTKAALELLKSVVLPWGFITGQKIVEGEIRDDSPWEHKLELKVRIDEKTYSKALLADKKWRNQNKYLNHPKLGENSYACQNYALDIARNIGLNVDDKNWRIFPPENFIKLAKLNGIEVRRKLSLGPG